MTHLLTFFIYKILNIAVLFKLSLWTLSVFAQHFKFQQILFSKKRGIVTFRGASSKLRRTTIVSLVSVRLSVRMEQVRSRDTHFREI